MNRTLSRPSCRRRSLHRHLAGLAACASLLTLAPASRGWAQGSSTKPGIVASVNGRELSEAEFHRLCERHVGGGTDTAVGYVVLREWVQHVIAEDEATRKKLLPSAQEVERRLTAIRKQFEFRGESFEEWLTTHGRTIETLRTEVRNQLIAENLLTEGVTVSDAEVALYYANNKFALGIPEQITASRITVESKDSLKEVERGLKNGATFETLARRFSIDPYKDASGKIASPIDADPKSPGPLEKDVLEKVLKLEPGKVAGPVKVEDYWVFVRLDGRFPARAPELTDVQDLLMANLKVQKGGPDRLKTAQGRLTQLQREAKIEIHRPEYGRLLKLFKGQ